MSSLQLVLSSNRDGEGGRCISSLSPNQPRAIALLSHLQ